MDDIIVDPTDTPSGTAARNAGKQAESLLALWSGGRKPDAYAAAQQRLAAAQPVPAGQRAEALLVQSLEREEHDDYDGAIRLAAEAAAVEPRFLHARLRHASLLRRTGRWQEALKLAEEAVRSWPRQPLPRIEFAQCLTEATRHMEAQQQYLGAIRFAPEHAAAHMGLAESLLMTEDWMPGWREYAWRTRMPATADKQPNLPMPLWNGMRLPKGRLILHGDQGYGDCIQFCRFIPRAIPLVGEIVLATSEKLEPLLGRIEGISSTVNRWEHLPTAAAYARLSDLPLLFGGEERDLDAGACYMPLETRRIDGWRQRLRGEAGDALTVGLCWSGRTNHLHNRLRSLALKTLAPLANQRGAHFFSLQFDEEKKQLADWPGDGAAITDLSGELEGFDETAHCLAALDLVITIDTVTAHLAGAVGVPTWTLLRRVPDWRWLAEREDSPWYPTMRLFRQDDSRTWEPLIGRVGAELAAVLAGERERLLPAGGTLPSS